MMDIIKILFFFVLLFSLDTICMNSSNDLKVCERPDLAGLVATTNNNLVIEKEDHIELVNPAADSTNKISICKPKKSLFLAVSPNNSHYAFRTKSELILGKTATESLVNPAKLKLTDELNRIHFSNNNYLVSGESIFFLNEDGKIQCKAITNENEDPSFFDLNDLNEVVIATRKNLVALVINKFTIEILEYPQARKINEFFFDDLISALAFDPEAKFLLVGSQLGWIYLYNFDYKKSLMTIQIGSPIKRLWWSSDYTPIIIQNDENKIFSLDPLPITKPTLEKETYE